MKKHLPIYAFVIIVLLASCQGSTVYQGNWKATDVDNNKYEIDFEPKSFKITDSVGKVSAYQYTQNSVSIENSVKKYGLQLNDGRMYFIVFPLSNDTTKAIMTLENNQAVYVLCRTSHIAYEELYKLAK